MAGTTDTSEDVYALVRDLAGGKGGAGVDPVARLVEVAATRRAALEEVRNRFAERLHGSSDDFEATTALRLLNRALATAGPTDRWDWKVRWARGRKP